MADRGDMFLTAEELHSLTHRSRRAKQMEALRQMGLEYGVRPDGTLAVLRTHVEKTYGGLTETTISKRVEPNWNAISA